MAGLCLVLYTIVVSRVESKTDVIFGGVDGAYVRSDSVSFVDQSTLETPEPTEDIWPQIDINLDQYSMVRDGSVNTLLSPRFQPTVGQISVTKYQMFSVAALPYLEDMLQAIQDAGFNVYIASSYRSYSYQEQLFNGKASQIALGMDPPVTDYLDPRYQDAVEQARTITAYPGSSEHQLGLAIDLMDKAYATPYVYENMNQAFYEWVDAHCADYGFIKRYPTRKLLLTGWDEPWHYRYVGVEAAKFIMENNLCYEEFYAHYVPDFQY
ncbi:MAG: M15 family metallopeptidase [Oscillospiraceae bacterium]|nr:M15 family metallopeptidase [Oscillospiraceae bacterium]